MEKLFLDFMGKFLGCVGGNTFILTVVEAFSKFAKLVPVREPTLRSELGALRQIVA